MDLLPTDIFDGVGCVALVGVAKNCGKTTTLNYLLGCGVCDGRTVGLVSVGIDGESSDLLIGTRKPPIHVQRDQWVVTARDALRKSSARIEYVASLGFSTPLGEVVCGRVIEAGSVVLAGMRHGGDLERAAGALEAHGVDLVLVDGAYGRTVAARGGLADAVIVSTGAVLGGDVEAICDATTALIDRLSLAPVEAGWQRALIDQAIAEDRCLLGGPGVEPVALPARSALVGLRQLAGSTSPFTDRVLGLAVPGLVSDSVIEHLLGVAGSSRVLLVPDGTVLQARAALVRRLARTWQIRAACPAQILAISVNPTGIQGHAVDDVELRAALHWRWPSIHLFNPLHSAASPA